MKQFLFILLCIVGSLRASGQATPMQWRHSNLVLFAGQFSEVDSSIIRGGWKGVYADVALFRSADEAFNLGLWGLYSRPKWENTEDKFKSTAHEVAFGLTGGYYDDIVGFVHALYIGGAIGYKHISEKGIWQSATRDQSLQNDDLVIGILNLNLLKHDYGMTRWLPRTQLIITHQAPQKSARETIINKKRTETAPWDKTSTDILFKQSIYDIPLSYELFLQPKIGFQYSRYSGPDAKAWIIEAGIRKIYADDFFTLSYMAKKDIPEKPGYQPRTLHFLMGSVNLIALFKKY
ncbi:MAG: hypothetical protein ACM3PZ_02820 [Bacillota bacterium]